MQIGQNLKVLRKMRGLTQQQLASKVHMSACYYAQIERNERTANEQRLTQLAAALDVTTGDLIGDYEPEEMALLDIIRRTPPERRQALQEILQTWKK